MVTMKNLNISIPFMILVCLHALLSNAQIKDTVYFDLEGEIIIKEVASIYRIAVYDTLTGHIADFIDYSIKGKKIANGKVNYEGNIPTIFEYAGDSIHQSIALNMCNMKASFIRINDYPLLKKIIKPRIKLEERIAMPHKDPREIFPVFPGGDEVLFWFIDKLKQYPEEARKNNVTGRVSVTFVIETDGSLNDIKVTKSLGYGCDEEAIRVIKSLPDWLPGIQLNKPVRFAFSIPIIFE
jgi:TonB family protein